jgi:integrase
LLSEHNQQSNNTLLVRAGSHLLSETMNDEEYQAFAQFLKERSNRQLREVTIGNYLTQTRGACRKYKLDLSRLSDLSHIRSVLESAEDNLSSASMDLLKFTLRFWFEFKAVPISPDMARLLKHHAGPKRRKLHPADLLTVADLQDITTHSRSPSTRAYLWVLYDTGARPTSLCDVDLADIQQDSHGYVIDFKKTKTEQSRRPVRLLMPESIGALDQWLAVHPDRTNPEAPLFVNTRNKRMSRRLLTMYLKEYHEKRLNKTLNLYLFRKSRATALLKEGRFSELEVKARLGHEKGSQMMGRYYAILDEADQARSELEYLGVESKEEGQSQPVICPSCGSPNLANAARCSRCLRALSESALAEETAIVDTLQREIAQRDFLLDYMGADIKELKKQMLGLLKVANHWGQAAEKKKKAAKKKGR